MEIEKEVLEKVLNKLHKGEVDFMDLRKEMQCEKEVAIFGIKKNIQNLRRVIHKFENDKDIAKIACEIKGELIKFFSQNIKDDIEIVSLAIKNNIQAIEFASERIRDKEELMINLVEQEPDIIMFASNRLKTNKEFMLLGLSKKIGLLKHIPEYAPNLDLDNEVIIKTLRNYSLLLNGLLEEANNQITESLLSEIHTFCEEIYNQLKKEITEEDFPFVLDQYAMVVYSGELVKNNSKKNTSKKTSLINNTNLNSKSKSQKPRVTNVKKDKLVSSYHKSEIDSISKSRSHLLIEKYANDTISEEIAVRLDILDKRLMEKSPRILESQLALINQSVSELEAVKSSKELIAAKLAEAAKR